MTIINGSITQGDDRIVTDNESDRIDALAGNDTVFGNGGNDSLFGNFGNDSLLGGNDNDSLLGGEQRDTIDGGNNNDTIDGGIDNDSLIGGTGNNLIKGGAGNDTLIAANGTNAAPGDLGDTLFGGEGKDTLRVEGASSYILTNTTLNVGNVLIHQLPVASNKAEGVIESIRLNGNSLGNTIDASAALLEDRTFLFGREGSDNIIGSQGLDQISGGSDADSLVGGAGFNFIDGDGGNDTLIGGNDDNNLEGGAGNDLVQGGTKGDFFEDSIFDEAGDDRYIGGGGDDDFSFFSGASFNGGNSENISYRLASSFSNPDNAVLTGGKLIPGTANFDDSATGTDTLEGIENVQISGTRGLNRIDAFNYNGDVILNGLGGNDNIIGGRGNDSLRGDGFSNDRLSGNLGNDTLDGGGFGGDTDILTGGNAFNGVGSADTFQIIDGYRGTGNAVISDFSVQDGDILRLRFPFQGSPSDFTFVQQNFPNTGTGTNSSSVLDTGIFFGAPSAGDLIAIVEDVNITATTPGVEIFG
jgi:Ca2+-binding RTX toxin-like protein